MNTWGECIVVITHQRRATWPYPKLNHCLFLCDTSEHYPIKSMFISL
jgi:hypothetical protein